MSEEAKGVPAPDETVTRLLDLQQRYGMDQDTMLIYISSVNLMSILNLISRRYGGAAAVSIPVPDVAATPPALVPGSGLALDNLVGMLAKMLGGKGGGSLTEGQGLNPAFLMNLLKTLGLQNMDMGSLMSLLSGLVGSGAKPGPKPGADGPVVVSGPDVAQPTGSGVKEGNFCEEKTGKRETPKIMKWDQLEDRKKA